MRRDTGKTLYGCKIIEDDSLPVSEIKLETPKSTVSLNLSDSTMTKRYMWAWTYFVPEDAPPNLIEWKLTQADAFAQEEAGPEGTVEFVNELNERDGGHYMCTGEQQFPGMFQVFREYRITKNIARIIGED